MVGLGGEGIKCRTTLFYRYNFLLSQMNWLSDLNSFRRVPFKRCTYSCYWSKETLFFNERKLYCFWAGVFYFSPIIFFLFLSCNWRFFIFLYCKLIPSDFYKKQMFWVLNLNYIVKKHLFTHLFFSFLSSLRPWFYF